MAHIFLFIYIILQRTKIWAKYSKDIETYVDKRAHLGEWLDLLTSWYKTIISVLMDSFCLVHRVGIYC